MYEAETYCAATRADGQPCRARAGADGFCPIHSPDPVMQQKVAAGRSLGGQGRSTAARAERLLPRVLRSAIHETLHAMQACRNGTMQPAQARAIAACAAVVVRAYVSGVEFEQLRSLEAKLGVSTDEWPDDEAQ